MKVRLEFYGSVTVIPEYVGNGVICVIDEDLRKEQLVYLVSESLRTGSVLTDDIMGCLDRSVLLEWAEELGLHY